MGAEQSQPAAPVGGQANDASGQGDAQNASSPVALVVCGPSGVGKGTLINMLLEGSEQYGFSVSHTTRPPRAGEQVCCHCRKHI